MVMGRELVHLMVILIFYFEKYFITYQGQKTEKMPFFSCDFQWLKITCHVNEINFINKNFITDPGSINIFCAYLRGLMTHVEKSCLFKCQYNND